VDGKKRCGLFQKVLDYKKRYQKINKAIKKEVSEF